MNRTRIRLAAAVFLTVVLLAPAPAHADDAQVAFNVKDGWVEMTLTRDAEPIPDVRIKVFDHRGGKFAEGETGPLGRGEFPLPPGDSLMIEFTVGDRTADPIRLSKVDDRVVPTRVLLSYGLSPCCKVPKRVLDASPGDSGSESAAPTPGSLPVWVQVAGSVAFALVGLTLLWISRPRRVAN